MFGTMMRAICAWAVERVRQCRQRHRLDIVNVRFGASQRGDSYRPALWVNTRGHGGRRLDAFGDFPQTLYPNREAATAAARSYAREWYPTVPLIPDRSFR